MRARDSSEAEQKRARAPDPGEREPVRAQDSSDDAASRGAGPDPGGRELEATSGSRIRAEGGRRGVGEDRLCLGETGEARRHLKEREDRRLESGVGLRKEKP